MIGVIERIKNNVLLKCSTLNDEVISKTLEGLIKTRIYRFSEEMISILGNATTYTEESLREETSNTIFSLIVKKIKRKLFIDSLALQITNDQFIEDYVKENIDLIKLEKTYNKELSNNKSSNQLNMTEDLNLEKIINELRILIDRKIISHIKENTSLVTSVNKLIDELKNKLEEDLKEMIKDTDNKYFEILKQELLDEVEEKKVEKGESDIMNDMVETNDFISLDKEEKLEPKINKFEKYDDMTLFNKMILSLNTEEEKLSRKEEKLETRKSSVEERLADTNKNIEANIERENKLSQRKLELNAKEIEINSKLSEAEVIFLNMKPLIKGLSKIKDSNVNGGNENE